MSTILLDFDGIILCNKNIEKIITKRSIEFVAKHRSKSFEESILINKHYYKTHGHTSLGFVLDSKDQSWVHEYNDYVFNKNNYNEIYTNLNDNDFYHLKNLQYLLSDVSLDSIGLFTNAPLAWCTNTLNYMNFELNDIFNQSLYFTSDMGYVKPQKEIYDIIDENVANDIIFIDDNEFNFDPVINKQKWDCKFVQNSNHEKLYSILRDIY